MRKLILALCLGVNTLLNAQSLVANNNYTEQVLQQVNSEFSKINYLPDTQTLQWAERTTSFTTQGIKTFVGYLNGNNIAYLSIDKQGNAVGSIKYGSAYYISGKQERIVLTKMQIEKTTCGMHQNAYHQEKHDIYKTRSRAIVDNSAAPKLGDGIFRHYRLAVYMSYHEYCSPKFNKDINKIKAFWAELETYLNDIYVRDLGVYFTIVNDDKLIEKENKGIYFYYSGTNLINKAIGSDAYDAGVVLDYAKSGGINGLAHLGGIKSETHKAWAIITSQNVTTIAHELGHLLGSDHPFKQGAGIKGMGTEPSSGQSIVSYGHPYKNDFVSLECLKYMYPCVYYADNRIKDTNKAATNTAPVIHRDKMKTEYKIPKNTFFTIPVYASDKEQDTLSYYFNQYGCTYYNAATFPVFPPQHDNVLRFGRRVGDNLSIVANSENIPVGNYKFWLAVSDALPVEQAIRKRQAPLFDSYIANVRVVDATPFKITSKIDLQYEKGCKLHLTWGVDKNFFTKDSKVRITMSDDLGKTFKYTLMPCTDNNGKCDVFLPQHLIKKVCTYWKTDPNTGKRIEIFRTGSGVIKIETLDGEDIQYYDLTDQKSYNGGIVLIESKVKFTNLPTETYVKIKKNEALTTAPEIRAEVDNQTIMPTYNETVKGKLTIRTWSVVHEGKTYGVQQFIEREDNDNNETTQIAKNKGLNTNVKVSVNNRVVIVDNILEGQVATLYNAQGKIVATKKANEKRVQLSVLQSGIYVLTIDGNTISKLSIQK